MRRAAMGWAMVGLLAMGGCAAVVPGRPAATRAPAPGAVATRVATAGPATAGPTTAGGQRGGLVADVLADECLLTATELGTLLGHPVGPPAARTVHKADGSSSVGCVAMAGSTPAAMINVYGVRGGRPADAVRAEPAPGRRPVAALGEAAVVIDTGAGPTLQLAGQRHLVTILVVAVHPSDDAWRTAGAAALSRLPG